MSIRGIQRGLRLRLGALALTAAAFGVAWPGPAPASRSARVITLSASLRGSAEVHKGSPTGRGTAVIRLYAGAGKACWTLSVRRLDKMLSAHVHKARAGKEGPVVIPLGARFAKAGCVTGLKAKTINAIVTNPRGYYVNVHTRRYLNGAIRGQLHR
jgi:CHRD domain